MEIKARKQAIDARESLYNTGKPCRNGHLSDRYTSSGACKACIAESVAGVRRAFGRAPNTPERTAALEGLLAIRLRIVPLDVQTLLDTVEAMTLARRPALVASNVVGARKGSKPEGGTLLFIVNIDPEDAQLIKQMGAAMLHARGPNAEEVRARVFGAAAAQAEATRDNGETEWKFT